jgi:hypothetical protein
MDNGWNGGGMGVVEALAAADPLRQAAEREALLRDEIRRLERYRDMVPRLEVALGERAARLRHAEAETESLRSQVSAHSESERELRVLLLRAQETAQTLAGRLEAETRALPAPMTSARRAWWRVWA